VKSKALLFLKGIAMGAADVVPGVSGGTVAFITGIYDELLTALSRIPEAVWLLMQGQLKRAWQLANANFLLVLFSGVLLSILSLARLITWLLETQPIALWSFFFGLILVSCYLVARDIQRWQLSRWLSFAVGAGFAWWITVAAPVLWGSDPFSLFAAGAIAICAMILPGISGSFILLLMGLYPTILLAVKQLDMSILMVFAAGCLFGLLAFARVLRAALQSFRDLTLALLTGIMFGSLNKVWPWKNTLSWRIDSHGSEVPLLQENISPWQFAEMFQSNAQLLPALLLMLLGVVSVIGIERYADK
jgi:putative membrane protein